MAAAKSAGYSGTPLAQKLGIKAGQRVALLNAPEGFAGTLGDLSGSDVRTERTPSSDVIVWFVARFSELDKSFTAIARTLIPSGALWVAWPKKTSGVVT